MLAIPRSKRKSNPSHNLEAARQNWTEAGKPGERAFLAASMQPDSRIRAHKLIHMADGRLHVVDLALVAVSDYGIRIIH